MAGVSFVATIQSKSTADRKAQPSLNLCGRPFSAALARVQILLASSDSTSRCTAIIVAKSRDRVKRSKSHLRGRGVDASVRLGSLCNAVLLVVGGYSALGGAAV